jgi:hypothetical protein
MFVPEKKYLSDRSDRIVWIFGASGVNNAAAVVLTTVNAPYSKQLDAHALAHCLTDQTAAKAAPGHMSSFFGEVDPKLQLEFAHLFHISDAELAASAKAFAEFTGASYPLAA